MCRDFVVRSSRSGFVARKVVSDSRRFSGDFLATTRSRRGPRAERWAAQRDHLLRRRLDRLTPHHEFAAVRRRPAITAAASLGRLDGASYRSGSPRLRRHQPGVFGPSSELLARREAVRANTTTTLPSLSGSHSSFAGESYGTRRRRQGSSRWRGQAEAGRERYGTFAVLARRRRAAVTGQRRRSGRGDAQLLDQAVGVASRVHGLEAGLVHPQPPEVVTVPEEPWDQGLPPNLVSASMRAIEVSRRAGRRSRPRRRRASW